MVLGLKDYTGEPKEFSKIFKHNLEIIDKIDKIDEFINIIEVLSKVSNIEDKVIACTIKRYLMIKQQEIQGGIANTRNTSLIYIIVKFIKLFIKSFISRKNSKKVDIIIDSWYPDSENTFYGTELVNLIKNRTTGILFDVRRYKSVLISDIIKHFFVMPDIMKSNNRLKKAYNVDLTEYIGEFISYLIIGLAIKKAYSPKVIVSGNDNGFPEILAKAAGAKILLIQNGGRLCLSDSSFKYADACILFGASKIENLILGMKNQYSTMYHLGSIRLYYFLREYKGDRTKKYDILWVTSYNLMKPNGFMEGVIPTEYELQTIKLLSSIRHKYKIVHQCRYDDEIKDLKKLGLFFEEIDYIKNCESSVYESILKSDMTLSLCSSVNYEALALNKKIGFINLSGNNLPNVVFSELALEYNNESRITFEEFIDGLMNKNISNKSEYILQSNNFAEEVFRIINKLGHCITQ